MTEPKPARDCPDPAHAFVNDAAPEVPAVTPEVVAWPFIDGKTVVEGKYLIKGKLALGGMGRIYTVEHLGLGKLCVMKLLQPELHPFARKSFEDARDLIRKEARTLTGLSANTDSFVTVFDIGTVYVAHPLADSGGKTGESVVLDLPYYVMELLDGCNFDALIQGYQKHNAFIQWSVVINLAAQMARALCFAHAQDIVHRDIKPNNIYIHRRIDRKPVVKFIDFGISKKHGERGSIGSGTREYGAPELLWQDQLVLVEDKQSDIYPLCLVIYELAALVGPFVAPRHLDRNQRGQFYAHAHINESPPLLSTHRADAPSTLVALLHAGLSKKAENRPTAKQMATALQALDQNNAEADEQISELLATMRTGRKRSRVASQGGNRASTAQGARGAASSQQSDVFLKHSVPVAHRETKPFGVLSDSAMGLGSAEPLANTPLDEAEPSPTAEIVAHPRIQTVPMAMVLSRSVEANDVESEEEPLIHATDPMSLQTGELALATSEADLPVFSSMAGVFGGWEETQYRSSPLGSSEPLAGYRPSSSLFERQGLESALPHAPLPAVVGARALASESAADAPLPSVTLPRRARSSPKAYRLRVRYVAGSLLVAALLMFSTFGFRNLRSTAASVASPSPPATATFAPLVSAPAAQASAPTAIQTAVATATRSTGVASAPTAPPSSAPVRSSGVRHRTPQPQPGIGTPAPPIASAKRDDVPPYSTWLARPPEDVPPAESLYKSP